MTFTHLQVKTGYSFMDSTITIDKLVEKAKELHFNALALTDDGVLYGAVEFFKACRKKGIKPIIGMNVKVKNNDETTQLVMLCKNNQGYQRLVQLSTQLQTTQKQYIDMEQLSSFTTDVVGILPITDQMKSQLETGMHQAIYLSLEMWQQLFQQGDFYLGVSDFGHERDKMIYHGIKAFGSTLPAKVVALNDVCYLEAEDLAVYECLQAMKKQQTFQMDHVNHEKQYHHLRTDQEMQTLFHDWPEPLMTTSEITAKCSIKFNLGGRMIPSFQTPDKIDSHTYLVNKCQHLIGEKYDVVTTDIKQRLTYELEMIKSMQFSDYFLIVADFVQYAKHHDIMIGPGRGSAAGSLVSYVLGITEIDPIQYGLLFERFLNPERVSMPDIDIDIADNKRAEVIKYVREKYGTDHVAQIITFGTFGPRSVLRELMKVMEIDKQDETFILANIPTNPQPLLTTIKTSGELYNYVKQSKKLTTLFQIAIKLEGLPRHTSTHAAGVVISEKPLIQHTPLALGANETMLTQFPMDILEELGLLKMDFLGLRNLTFLHEIVRSLTHGQKTKIGINDIPKQDEKTFALLQNGQTNGVFQFESEGMKQVLQQLRPTTIEDIVAVNALYRPGPMEQIPTFIARKHGKEAITYPHPDLAPILEQTYGVLVYQEQIMQIAHQIAHLSLGQADILRRAVSKKKGNLIAEQKEVFIEGCLRNGYSHSVATEIFSWIVKFSNYGFNRSHAVAYSMIAYQLAYLKAHYPKYFFSELLTTTTGKGEKIKQYTKEIKALGLAILPPTINKSYGKASVERKGIRIGLSFIKGVGYPVIKEIITKRKQQPFKSLFDFCMCVSTEIVGRKTLETLIMAGTFDDLYANRASLLASIDKAIDQSILFQEFDFTASLLQNQLELEDSYVELDDFPVLTKLAQEKELLGMYVSSHPLKNRRQQFNEWGCVTIAGAKEMIGRHHIQVIGIVESIKMIRTKRGESMAFVMISDETDDIDLVVFPDVLRKNRPVLQNGATIYFEGKMEMRKNRLQMIVMAIREMKQEKISSVEQNRLFVKVFAQDSEKALQKINEFVQQHSGDIPIIIYHVATKRVYQLADYYRVAVTDECLALFQSYFGMENVVFDKKS